MSDLSPSAESFRSVPHDAETFGMVPKSTEVFRSMPKTVERSENHTLTVREVARMFEAAGVARIERTIINWCQPGKFGVAKLDAFYDPNERRYFISPQSVELAIKEEQAKIRGRTDPTAPLPKSSELVHGTPVDEDTRDQKGSARLKQELIDLKITNYAKDQIIDQLRKEREDFAEERKDYIEKLITSNRHIGELETKLLQLQGPAHQ